MGGRRGVDPPVKLPNNLLQQTAASLSVSQGILPSRPPLLSFGVRPQEGFDVEVRPDPEGYDRLFVSAPELDAQFEVFGACPVQALGTVRGRDLYFRARHGDWWFEVADGSGTLPSDGGSREPDGFYRDGVDPHYGRMPLPEAVTVIVECLPEYTGGPGRTSSCT